MHLTRPLTGWKRFMDPMTWAGIQDIAGVLIPVIEAIPRTKLLGAKTTKRNPNGMQIITYAGPAGTATWDSGTAGVTIGTEFMAASDDPEQFKGFSVVPSGKVWLIPYMTGEHNDGTARYVFLRVYDFASSSYVDVGATTAAVTPNGRAFSQYPLVLREGMKIGLSVPTLAAGQVGTIRAAIQEIAEDEQPPWI